MKTRTKKRTRIKADRSALTCACLWFALTSIAGSQGLAALYSPLNTFLNDQEILDRSDCVIFMSVSQLDSYFKYQGANLNPVTQIRCNYAKGASGMSTPGSATQPLQYEDLWYYNGQPIGCRRYNPLTMRPRQTVTICVQPSSEARRNTRAVANAIVRVAADFYANQYNVSSVIVPEEITTQLLTDFGAMNFHQKQLVIGTPSIHLVSNPSSFDANLYFSN